jgi:hypothetical protein
MTLDCTSLESATNSLSQLLGKTGREFRACLREIQLRWSEDVAPNQQLAHHLGFADRFAYPEPDDIIWFHATRLPAGGSLPDGLLPTSLVEPKVWDFLGSLATRWLTGAEWERYKATFYDGARPHPRIIAGKRLLERSDGPFAFLVRDAALGRVTGASRVHKDFTAVPELIEDICLDFQEVYSKSLLTAFRSETLRCLVVFKRPGDWRGAVSAALMYVYLSVHEIGQNLDSNANFNGKGRFVPPSWITDIDWLPTLSEHP